MSLTGQPDTEQMTMMQNVQKQIVQHTETESESQDVLNSLKIWNDLKRKPANTDHSFNNVLKQMAMYRLMKKTQSIKKI